MEFFHPKNISTMKRNFFYLFLLLGFFTQHSLAAKPKAFGKYYALVIGINDYKGSTWSPLNNAVNDAKAIEEVLKGQYAFDEVLSLYDKDATRANILQDITSISKKVGENDNLLVFYSGHGIMVSGAGYWVPSDAQTDGIYALVSNDDIKNILGACKSKHTLLIVDACFSGTMLRDGAESPIEKYDANEYYEEIYKYVSRQAITSGDLSPVPDSKGNICDGKHSVFSCYLLKRLRENDRKYIEAAELFQRIKIPVSRSAVMPRFGYIRGVGDEGGQFVFRQSPNAQVSSRETNENNETGGESAAPGSYGISTGSPSGTYIVFGKDIRKVMEKQIPLNVLTSKGSQDNFNKLLDGENGVHFAIVQYDVLQSEDKSGLFRKNKSEDIKMIFPLYGEEIHILARKGGSVNTFSDLKGKKVVVGTEGSGTWISMQNLKKKLGIQWNGIAKSFDAGLKDLTAGKVDAVIYVAGSPTSKLGGLGQAASNFIQLVSIPEHEKISQIYQPTIIKKGTYDWVDEDIKTYSIMSILVSYDYEKGTKEYDVVSKLVTGICSNLSTLQGVGHTKWKEVCPSDYDKVPWEMHPAAKEAIDAWKMINGSCD